MSSVFIHQSSEILSKITSENVSIWQFVVVCKNVSIGSNVNICSHCFIENGVTIGNNVTIKNGNYIYEGTVLMDNVFIGPNVTFTNDKYPKSKKHSYNYPETVIKSGASIGGGSVLLPGVTVGENALIGAGTVVINDVPDNTIVRNNLNQLMRAI